ncbi:putative endonuclease [Burkholderia phage Mica]|uniref:Putative endonuclease n=1 Tax=Burkholderia phage Mica TaxID=2767579 RepID=A0A873WF21_9CAUD|nr:putative endonuclease [Burkholderia phage Mica]QPB08658.1 putative endonuclease [Burkholderia phage Mica]
MNALPLEGGYHAGPLFVIQKRRASIHRLSALHGYRRRRIERERTPPWADLAAIRAMYAEAERLTRETGELHVVDHIVPLRGKIVSGLHWHGNMRVIHWRANASKGALTWPDMPMEQLELI